MDIFDIFRKIFARHHQNINPESQYRNSFRNPIWQNEEDDDEDNDGDFRNQQGIWDEVSMFGNGDINIDLNVGQDFPDIFDSFNKFFQQFSDGIISSNFIDSQFHSSLPQIESSQQNLRDKYLKPSVSSNTPSESNMDISLDGKITSDNLSNFWNNSKPLDIEPVKKSPQFRFCQQSVSTKIINTSNGKEMQKTIKDCDGSTTTIIKKETADKIHTISITKDKDGVETRKEDIIEKSKDQSLIPKNDSLFPSEPLNDFPWSKYFGPKF